MRSERPIELRRSRRRPAIVKAPRRCALVGSIAAIVALAGCSSSRTLVSQPVVEIHPTAFASLDFFEELRRRPIVSNADALHALLLFAGLEAPGEWESALATAVQAGWIDPAAAHDLNPSESARVGLIGSIVASVSDVGLGALDPMLASDAWSPNGLRAIAATTRLRRLSLIPDRSANQALTGAELLTLLRRAEIFEQTREAEPGADLPAP